MIEQCCIGCWNGFRRSCALDNREVLSMQQLATLLLVQALRVHLETSDGAGTGTGWFLALADKRINAAITPCITSPPHPGLWNPLAPGGLDGAGPPVRLHDEFAGGGSDAPPLERLSKLRATVHVEDGACYPARLIGSEEGDHTSDVIRPCHALH